MAITTALRGVQAAVFADLFGNESASLLPQRCTRPNYLPINGLLDVHSPLVMWARTKPDGYSLFSLRCQWPSSLSSASARTENLLNSKSENGKKALDLGDFQFLSSYRKRQIDLDFSKKMSCIGREWPVRTPFCFLGIGIGRGIILGLMGFFGWIFWQPEVSGICSKFHSFGWRGWGFLLIIFRFGQFITIIPILNRVFLNLREYKLHKKVKTGYPL